ncbi:MAG: DegT/DnrJ/EryC1/StrS family aminotransferase [Caldilineaceae bacterium]|nr:DegT/DnrJ/EryC1/StrS family aminotransferase [Caldilineaceae bacterium]
MSVGFALLDVPLVDLVGQYAELRREVNEAMEQVLATADLILGHDVELFEQEFAAYCGAEYAVGVDSGTSALELILRACEIGPGDEVITVDNTFIATVLAISMVGAMPRVVDIDPTTYTLDVSQVEAAITERTRAIIPVHLYGQPAEMKSLREVARKHNLVVIEDACQAHGARYRGQRVGTLGDAAAFSFYPAKNLGAYGDGGMIVTNDAQVAHIARMLRNYGQSRKYHHDMLGYNRRLDTLQAAVLRVKLRYLDEWNQARCQHARAYGALLAGSGLSLPVATAACEPVYHLYVVRSDQRDKLQAHLSKHHIMTGIHYPIPVHLQPAYSHLGYEPGTFPVTEQYAKQILSLPMYPELTPGMIEYVAAVIHDFDSQCKPGIGL